jgi:hypothetical protein
MPSLRAALIITTSPGEFWPHHTTFDLPGTMPSSRSTFASRFARAFSSKNVIVSTLPSGRSSMTAGLSGWSSA